MFYSTQNPGGGGGERELPYENDGNARCLASFVSLRVFRVKRQYF